MNSAELLGKLEVLKDLEESITKKEKEARIKKINAAYDEFMDKWGEDIEALKIIHKNGMFLRKSDKGKEFLHSYGEVIKDWKCLKFYRDDRGDWHLEVDGVYHNIFYYKDVDHGDNGLEECLNCLKEADERMPLLIKSATDGVAYYENQLRERLNNLGGVK